jgi:aryl-alcohol dehydrogenase-like predicted oxidoreductase
MMEKRSIADLSVRISPLGFGCARLFGGLESRASTRLIETALEQGISHFDTAPSYGSEYVLGEILAGVQGVTIATKVGVSRAVAKQSTAKRVIGPLYRSTVRPLLARAPTLKARLLRGRGRAPTSAAIGKRILSADEVLRELDESLRRLRRTAVDIYLIHEPDAIELTDDLRELFLSLQRSGAIKAFGLAFGGAPKPVSFGDVVQCRYDAEALAVPHQGELRIYHGVIRLGMQSHRESSCARRPDEMVREALDSHPNAAVIVSASTPRQLLGINIWDGSGR